MVMLGMCIIIDIAVISLSIKPYFNEKMMYKIVYKTNDIKMASRDFASY